MRLIFPVSEGRRGLEGLLHSEVPRLVRHRAFKIRNGFGDFYSVPICLYGRRIEPLEIKSYPV